MSQCRDCGGLVRTHGGSFDYSEAAGLPVRLEGVTLTHCDDCGADGVRIPSLAELHRLIATDIARAHHRLSGAEVRFIREWLGHGSAEFAKLCRVSPETVSRWENDRATIGDTAEQLVRLLAVVADPAREFSADDLPVTRAEAPSQTLRMQASARGWEAA